MRLFLWLAIMTLEFLVQQDVREILFELFWGDRFEKDLVSRMGDEGRFLEIRDRLVKEELVYQFYGENESPYLSLTDKGVAIVNRLDEIERILEGEDIDSE
jgi:hypothetical protein